MLIDTNILIAYLKGESSVKKAILDWKKSDQDLYVSSISVAEILALPSLSAQEIKQIKLLLRSFISIPLDDEIAENTAFIKRTYGLKLPDAAIAASALFLGITLVSRDRQFSKVKEIKAIKL